MHRLLNSKFASVWRLKIACSVLGELSSLVCVVVFSCMCCCLLLYVLSSLYELLSSEPTMDRLPTFLTVVVSHIPTFLTMTVSHIHKFLTVTAPRMCERPPDECAVLLLYINSTINQQFAVVAVLCSAPIISHTSIKIIMHVSFKNSLNNKQTVNSDIPSPSTILSGPQHHTVLKHGLATFS